MGKPVVSREFLIGQAVLNAADAELTHVCAPSVPASRKLAAAMRGAWEFGGDAEIPGYFLRAVARHYNILRTQYNEASIGEVG